MDSGTLLILVLIGLYLGGAFDTLLPKAPEQKEAEQKEVWLGTNRGGDTEEVKAPVVLYTEPAYQGTALPLTPGRNVYFGFLHDQGKGNCPSKGANPLYNGGLTKREALKCWEMKYGSLKADPGYFIDFWRNSGGHTYKMRIDPSETGNMPYVDAETLESYVDYSSGNPYGCCIDKTAALPYYYWHDDLYLRVAKKPPAPANNPYTLAPDPTGKRSPPGLDEGVSSKAAGTGSTNTSVPGSGTNTNGAQASTPDEGFGFVPPSGGGV